MTAHVLEPVRLELPFWRYFDLFRKRARPFLLDSAADPQKLGRFSFMGADPALVFRAKRVAGDAARPHRAHCRLVDARGAVVSETVANPFDVLRAHLKERAVDGRAYAGRPVPLLAGAVGYFGFEAGMFIEALPDTGRDDLALPDIDLGFYDAMLVHCHQSGVSYVSALDRDPDERIAAANARRACDDMLRRIEAFERDPTPEWSPSAAPSQRNIETRGVTGARYGALVERAKDHVFAGDVFELCLTHRLESSFAGDAWDLYRELRRINPAPFA